MGYGVATSATLPSSSFPPQNRRFHSIDSLPKMHVLNGVHIPIKKARGRCQWCSLMKDMESRTMYACRMCGVNLCIDCFGPFHDFRG
jgi:hypothetical protein